LVPPEEPLVLGVAIAEMLALRAEERAAIGVRARMTIGQRYSVERMVESYAQLYRTMVGKPLNVVIDEGHREAA
jgi:glycosyltransferase involved in cell wall biosynthesis